MPGHKTNHRSTLAVVEDNLQQAAQLLLSKPGQTAAMLEALERAQALLEKAAICDLNGESVRTLQARALQVHRLVESALAFHCGALLTSPAVEYTYSPAGRMLTAAARANLNLEA